MKQQLSNKTEKQAKSVEALSKKEEDKASEKKIAKEAKAAEKKAANTLDDMLSCIIKKLPKPIQTKLQNINKAGVEGPCTTKRVSQQSRVSIPYYMIKNLTLKQLQTYENGLVVRLSYLNYVSIRDNLNRNELDEYLFKNIGGDNIVSCFICITKNDGYSGSTEQRVQLINLKLEITKNNWMPMKRNNDVVKNVNMGNDKWSGHYYYAISGGQQESFNSHQNKCTKNQIFTTYKGFMCNNKTIKDVKISLIFQLLHCFDITDIIPNELILQYKKRFEEYLKSTYYQNLSCYALIQKLGVIKKGELYSPINCERLSIYMFEKVNFINISHNEAVSKKKIYFCDNNNILLSDYRPGNLFWDLKLCNMQQQDFTIDEYWVDHDKRSALRASLLLVE